MYLGSKRIKGVWGIGTRVSFPCVLSSLCPLTVERLSVKTRPNGPIAPTTNVIRDDERKMSRPIQTTYSSAIVAKSLLGESDKVSLCLR